MKNEELKPCPFCGGEVVVDKPKGMPVTFILCGKCGACVSFRGKGIKPATIAAWNRRADK